MGAGGGLKDDVKQGQARSQSGALHLSIVEEFVQGIKACGLEGLGDER